MEKSSEEAGAIAYMLSAENGVSKTGISAAGVEGPEKTESVGEGAEGTRAQSASAVCHELTGENPLSAIGRGAAVILGKAVTARPEGRGPCRLVSNDSMPKEANSSENSVALALLDDDANAESD